MPLKLFGVERRAKALTLEEGMRILDRDHYRCQYCGLDGLASFENSLIMSVDFVLPRIRRGKKEGTNLVAACRPCNVIKGEGTFKSFDEAKAFVLRRRDELRKEWRKKAGPTHTSASA
jgi:5-methylcytosine-specific restriction endonuclease McrA